MSAPCKFEMSVLKHDEQEIIRDTHHPVIAEMNRERLEDLRSMLRSFRLSPQEGKQVRPVRGSRPPQD